MGPASAAQQLLSHQPDAWVKDTGPSRHHGYSQHVWLKKIAHSTSGDVPLKWPVQKEHVVVDKWEPDVAQELLRGAENRLAEGTWALTD